MKIVVKGQLGKKLTNKKKYIFSFALVSYTFLIVFAANFILKGSRDLSLRTYLTKELQRVSRAPGNYVKAILTPSNDLVLDIKHKDILKINNDRQEALKYGELFSSNSDWVNATGTYKNEKYRFKLRLKGAMPRHWADDEFWSFKLKVRDGKTLFGMKRFSIQHPSRRVWMNEWYFHQILRYAGIISSRYSFTPLVINGKRYPVYAVEENFDKYLIENNNRREGPIFKLSSRKGPDERRVEELIFYQYDKYIADEKMSKLLKRAEWLIDGYLSGELRASEVFDIDLMAKTVAIMDLLGHKHALYFTNIRYYLNPITGLIEPIPFDNQYVGQISKIGLIGENINQALHLGTSRPYDYLENSINKTGFRTSKIISLMFSDYEFIQSYGSALQLVSDSSWLTNFFANTDKSALEEISLLRRNNPFYQYEHKNLLFENQNYIRSIIRPRRGLRSSYSQNNLADGLYPISVSNFHTLPLEITSLVGRNGDIIPIDNEPIYIGNRPKKCIDLNCTTMVRSGNIYQELSLKLKKDAYKINNLGDFSLLLRVPGSDFTFKSQLFPNNMSINDNNALSNLLKLQFIDVNENTKIIKVKKGSWTINNKLIIPKGYVFYIEPDTTLNLINSSSIISYSPVHFVGEEKSPIIFKSEDRTGQGISVIRAPSISNLSNLIIQDLGSLSVGGISLTGSLTFYQSDVNIDSVVFDSNKSEDALNIIRSNFNIKNSTFYNTFSDAIDFDFSSGNVDNLEFQNIGNDGIDLSGTKANISNIRMFNVGDKGLSVGEKSKALIKNITIANSLIGIASKDQSKLEGEGILIQSAKIGVAVYQKKPEYGPSSARLSELKFKNINSRILAEVFSNVFINNQKIESNRKNIYDYLYPE